MARPVDREFLNVGEEWVLNDSILIYEDLESLGKQPNGWFTSFANFAAAPTHSFFNVRSKGDTHPAYNNLDTRDQIAFAFIAKGIALSFWGSGFESLQNELATARYPLINALWQAVLPQHCSATLRIDQVEVLKSNASMWTPGFGPTGGGWGHNYLGIGGLGDSAPVYGAITGGVPSPPDRFQFIPPTKIPRRASLEVRLGLTQYAINMLQAMPGPFGVGVWDEAFQSKDYTPVPFGIMCSLYGTRYVQQRGELHA